MTKLSLKKGANIKEVMKECSRLLILLDPEQEQAPMMAEKAYEEKFSLNPAILNIEGDENVALTMTGNF